MTAQTMYQVSTLQALAMGYTRKVITVEKLLQYGDIGLGTFEGVTGEMILLEGGCYMARDDGSVIIADDKTGVPFSAVTFMQNKGSEPLDSVKNIEELKRLLDLRIEEDFGLNSMHMVRIDGIFDKVFARAGGGMKSHHVSLKEILKATQKDFIFTDIAGTLVCVYFPDYMDGINAPGWHLHFVSADRSCGGHVFDMSMKEGSMIVNKISQIRIELPNTPAFDTYSLKDASQDEIKEVEQGGAK